MNTTSHDTLPKCTGQEVVRERRSLRGLHLSSATFVIAAALSSTGAQAQTVSTKPEGAPSAEVLQEVIVTAQRREQSLTEVPLAVSALSADALQEHEVTNEHDLASLVPGLVVKNGQNSNQLSFTLRGQTLDPFSGASPAVLSYFNEVPFSGGNSATSFFDFSSVQVLKGPQGTLFGRNATGGAVLYTSNLPGDVYGGNITVRGGERDLAEVQGGVDLPLVPGKLAVRLAGDYTRQDGYLHDTYTGHTLGDTDNQSGRISVVLTPVDKLKNVTVFQYSHFGGSEDNGELFSYYKLGQTNAGFHLTSTLDTVYGNGFFPGLGNGPPGPGTFPGAVAGYLAWQKQHPYDIFLSYDLPHDSHNNFVSNATTYEINSAVSIKNIFGYQESLSRTPGILSGSPFGSLDLYNSSGPASGPPGGETFRSESYSDELQLQGKMFADRLDYIFGGFYSDGTRIDMIPVIVGTELAAPLGQVLYHYKNTDRSEAVYGQVTYDLSDWLNGLKVTGGGRYTWETVGETPEPGDPFLTNFPVEKKNLSAPSWTASLQYQFSPKDQVYFTDRGSWRSGNFNGAVVPYNLTNFFGNEYTHDYEIGYKYAGKLFDRRVHFDVAAYDQIVDKAQHAVYAVVAGNPAAFTVNVPEATVKGVEADGDIQPNDWLKLGFSGAYTDAEYTKGRVDLSSQTGTPGYIVPFDSYPDAPRWSISLFADVTLPTPEEWGDMHIRADTFTQTVDYFSNNNGSITPDTKLDGYTTVSLRFNWNEIMGSDVSFGLFAKNLLNRFYFASGYVEGASGGFNTAIPGEPRTIGAELSAKF